MRRLLLILFTAAACFGGPPMQLARVVSQTVGTDELLLALAEPGQIAALSHLSRDARFTAVSREAAAHPQIPPSDAEGIVRFRPTLVLISSYSQPELVAQLERLHIRVMRFDQFNTLDEVYANLRRLAKELGTEAKAEALIARCQARVADLARRLKGVAPVRVMAPSSYGFIAGRDTTFQDLCDHAGALNVAAEAGLLGHAPTPSESVVTWKVDRLVLSGDDGAKALAAFRNLIPFRFMEVVKQGRYVLLKTHEISSVTFHRIDAYESLARQLHPERFR